MEVPDKKKRGHWTESQLQAALAAIKSQKMSQRQASIKYSVPRRTLRNHLKSGSTQKITGRLPVLTKLQESDLCKRIMRLAQIGMPLTPKIVRKQAYEFCKANSIPNPFNDSKSIAGKKWLRNYIKRNPAISLRRAQILNPARAQKLNKPIVQKHFEAIKVIYDELNISAHPERLYNMDEKGCRLTLHHQQKVFAAKGAKRVHFVSQEHAENVTIAMCVSATGNTVPPMILFKGKRLRPEFCDNLPPGSLVKMAPKGSMTTDLFVDFIHHLGQNKCPGKCLLIFDGASSHLDARIVDAADGYDILLYCLPSNTTHELQPLDKSVNKSYEHFWDEEVLLYSYQHPDRKLTKSRFTKIFTKVWSKCMTKENIISGFRATGLYPYDPSAIPDEAYAPSVLTQLPDPQVPCVSRMSNSTPDITSPRRHNYEEDSRNCSPSILSQTETAENLEYPTLVKLVEYSSSSECSNEEYVENQRQLQKLPLSVRNDICSPVPSTSGVNRQRFNSSTPELSDKDYATCLRNIYPTNFLNIYTSSSDEENLDTDSRRLSLISQQSHVQSDDFEDNVPLSTLKKDIEKSPFHKQIPTPNFAVIKDKPRRKAINYIGQKITKDLFDVAKDKLTKNTKKTNTSTKTKEIRDNTDHLKITKNKNKSKVIIKNTTNKKPNKNERPSKKEKVVKNITKKNRQTDVEKKKVNSIDSSWYCHGCKLDTVADMRQCKECLKWYHEDCVGLTKEDRELFMCPDCN